MRFSLSPCYEERDLFQKRSIDRGEFLFIKEQEFAYTRRVEKPEN